MKDIINKLALALFVSFGVMAAIIIVIFIQNATSEKEQIKISAFYFIIAVIFLGAGIYFKKLKKKM